VRFNVDSELRRLSEGAVSSCGTLQNLRRNRTMEVAMKRSSRNRTLIISFFLLVALFCGLDRPAMAQSTATFQGSVVDSQGGAIAGAKVVVKDTATSLERAIAPP
jgi:hypothetical protein